MTRSRLNDSIAGLTAAGTALAAGELVSALLGVPSLVVAIADAIVDHSPGALVRAGIDALGSSDKPALLAGIVLVALAIGVAAGPVAGRAPLVGYGLLVAFALVGGLAEARDPLTDAAVAAMVAGSAAVAGAAMLWALLRVAEEPSQTLLPGRGTGGRRRFLAFASAAAGASVVTAFTGRQVAGDVVDVEAQRGQVVLPDAEGGDAARLDDLPVEGISPLITPNEDFYRIDTAFVVPRVDASTWRLRVTGMVDHPFEVTFDGLLAMASIEEPVTLACVSNPVGGDLVGNAVWQGVPLAALLERAGVQPGATQVIGRSVEGFTTGFPTEIALDGRTAMVAFAMNGEPLPAEHGYPARLVVPGLYGYVSATKWLAEIELTTWDAFDAYWIPRGWSKEAPIKTQSRIDVPRHGREVTSGAVAVAGVAWGGIRSISRVEVRATPEDGAPGQWMEATLGPALSSSTWRQWSVTWNAVPGAYHLEVRATDGEGAAQTEERHEPVPDGATGYHTITVRVR